jgi:hypothetical protein
VNLRFFDFFFFLPSPVSEPKNDAIVGTGLVHFARVKRPNPLRPRPDPPIEAYPGIGGVITDGLGGVY